MFGLTFIKQKLDIMSGDIKNTEGIAKNILTRIRVIQDLAIKVHVKVDAIFELLESNVEEPDQSDFFFSQFKIDNIIIKGRLESISMNEFQLVRAKFVAKKKNGQPAQIQNPRAETDNPSVLVGEITGENEATFAAVEGSVTEPVAVLCKVIADADLGEGVREIEIIGSQTVTPGEAHSLEMTFGEPEDKPTEQT